MVPLQSSSTQPGAAIVVLVVLALVGAIVGALGSAVVRRLSNPVGKYRLLYTGVLVPFTLLTYGVLALSGFGSALVSLFPLDASGLSSTVLADFAELLAAGVVWLVAYAPTVRGVSEVRDIELPTAESLVRMARYVVGLGVIVTLLLAPLRVTGDVSIPAISIELAALGVLLLVVSPWILPVLRPTSRAAEDVTDRFTTLQERSGLDVRDVFVIDTDDEGTASAQVRGFPGFRRLFVTSTFVDRFDDETAIALLAIQAGRLHRRVLLTRVGTVIVSGLLLVASLTGVGPRWPVLGVSLATLVIGFWLSRRGIRVADDYAAERVGAPAVVDALERYAGVHALEPTRRRVPNPLPVNVALGDRIDRLSGRADEQRELNSLAGPI